MKVQRLKVNFKTLEEFKKFKEYGNLFDKKFSRNR